MEANAKQIWDFLHKKYKNDYAVAGIMGNLKAESSLRPNNVQDSFEKRTGISDDEYTKRVDNGKITRESFAHDKVGYGLAQWTFWSVKEGLYDIAKANNTSIGSLNIQIEYLIRQFDEYKLTNSLINARSVREASDLVLTKYEKPADQSESVKQKRAGFGQEYYNAFKGNSTSPAGVTTPASTLASLTSVNTNIKPKTAQYKDKGSSGGVQLSVNAKTGVNVRIDAGVNSQKITSIPFNTKVFWYGYYNKSVEGTKWYYVQFKHPATKTSVGGYICSDYLR